MGRIQKPWQSLCTRYYRTLWCITPHVYLPNAKICVQLESKHCSVAEAWDLCMKNSLDVSIKKGLGLAKHIRFTGNWNLDKRRSTVHTCIYMHIHLKSHKYVLVYTTEALQIKGTACSTNPVRIALLKQQYCLSLIIIVHATLTQPYTPHVVYTMSKHSIHYYTRTTHTHNV